MVFEVHICSILVFLSLTDGLHLPPYIKPCVVRSSNFSKCAVTNGNAAIRNLINGHPKFAVPKMNPLQLAFVTISTRDFTLNASDLVVTGIPSTKITDFRMNLKTQNVKVKFQTPLLQVDFNYGIGGKIGPLPIEGQGLAKIILYDGTVHYDFNYTLYGKSGKRHAAIENDEFILDPKNLFIHVDNLFNGNKVLGDSMNTFLNENWKELLAELTPVLSETAAGIIRKIVGTFFIKVSMEEIFIGF